MPDESGHRVRLDGSDRAPIPEATAAGPLDTSQRAEVTVVVNKGNPAVAVRRLYDLVQTAATV